MRLGYREVRTALADVMPAIAAYLPAHASASAQPLWVGDPLHGAFDGDVLADVPAVGAQ